MPTTAAPGSLCLVGFDFGDGVCHRKNDCVFIHRPHHLFADDSRRAYAYHYVRAAHGVGERSVDRIGIRTRDEIFLRARHTCSSLYYRSETVAHDKIIYSQAEQKFGDRDTRAARAVDNDFYGVEAFADYFYGVYKRGAENYRRTVLIVVKDGNIAYFFESALDLETAWRGYIFEVDPAETARNKIDRAHEFVNVLTFDANRNRVHVAELLEKQRFAFHNGHTGNRTYVAQTENRRSVGDYGDRIPAAGKIERLALVLLNFETGCGNAGGVRKRKVGFILDLYPRRNFDFTLPFVMFFQRFFGVFMVLLSESATITPLDFTL